MEAAAATFLPHVARLLTPTALLVFAAVVAGMINADGRLAALDRVQLYSFDKAAVNAGAATANNTPASGDWAWLWDAADTAHCLDMTALNFPTVRFIPGSDPRGPSCQIALTTVVTSGGNGPQFTIQPVYTAAGTVGCVPGLYALELGSGANTPVTATTLTIAPLVSVNGTTPLVAISVAGSAAGTGFTTGNQDKWATCNARRQALAGQYLNSTSCQTEASQMCTCVRAFAGRVSNPSTPLRAVLPNGTLLGDALNAAVGDCIALRRSHDVRSAFSTAPYRRTQALLVVALALLLNALHGSFQLERRHWGMGAAWLAVLTFAAALPSIPGVPGTEPLLQLAVYGPPLLAGAYTVYLDALAGGAAQWRPALHPSVFALVLCSLTLFTLVERGVVQAEYLFVEVFKCHAVAGAYAAGTWYHRYLLQRGEGESPFSAATVDQAHKAVLLAGLAAAADSLLVPYPAKAGFELHWLLPLAFAWLGLGWGGCARRPPDGVPHPHLLSHASLGAHAAAFLLCGYFLNEMLLTGDRRYADFLDPASGGLPLLARAA